jgi:hypothetical protein
MGHSGKLHDPVLEAASRSAGVSYTADNEAAIRAAEAVVVSATLESTAALIDLAARAASPGTLVTDLASVKGPVAEAYRSVSRSDLELVSLHPLHGPRVPSLSGVTVLAVPFRTGPRYDELLRFFISEGAQGAIRGCSRRPFVTVRDSRDPRRPRSAVQLGHCRRRLAVSRRTIPCSSSAAPVHSAFGLRHDQDVVFRNFADYLSERATGVADARDGWTSRRDVVRWREP